MYMHRTEIQLTFPGSFLLIKILTEVNRTNIPIGNPKPQTNSDGNSATISKNKVFTEQGLHTGHPDFNRIRD